MIFVLFWIFGVPYEAVAFTGDTKDIIILGLGLISTIATILYIPPYVLLDIAEDGTEKHRDELLANICGNVRSFAQFAIFAGVLTLLLSHVSVFTVPYAIVPEIFGILNVIILIFCPSEDTFR